jgi:lysophospholipase L1-like esterase
MMTLVPATTLLALSAMACAQIQAGASGLAAAHIPGTYLDAPLVYARDLARFSAVLRAGHTRTVRTAYLGDSQETSPSGAGVIYVPRLNYEFWRIFGNCPETPFVPVKQTTGDAPPCDWLVRSAQTAPGPDPGVIPENALLPQADAGLYFGPSIVPARFGALVLLENDAAGVHPGCQIAGVHTYFDRAADYVLDIFAATMPQSGGVTWLAKPTPSAAADYYAAVVAQGVLLPNLSSAELGIVRVSTPPLPRVSSGYMQVELCGSGNGAATQLLGSRFRSTGSPAGVVVSSFSRGGYQTQDFVPNHGQSGAMLRAIEPDLIMLGFGANDAALGVTAPQHREHLVSLIAWVRQELGDGFPVVIMTDPFRTDLPEAQQREHARYAWVEYELARQDPGVMTVNSRRALHALGWEPQGFWPEFLWDGVHYTAAGARAKAQVEAELLRPLACYANCDGSTAAPPLNVGDFTCFLQRFAAGDAYANCDASTGLPVLNVGDFTCFLQRFAARCP